MLETFTCQTFAPLLGGTFRIHADAEHSVEVELIEAVETGDSVVQATSQEQVRRAPFSLVFRGPRSIVLPQQIYRMEHGQLGDFELFLVPIGPDQAGMRYQAIFT